MKHTPEEISNRFIRHEGIVSREQIMQIQIEIIGCGAVGHAATHQVMGIGIPKMIVWDHDKVDTLNCGPQLYPPRAIDDPKVEVITKEASFMYPELEIAEKYCKFESGDKLDMKTTTVFSCVDSMESRESVYYAYQEGVSTELFIDARMTSNLIRIITHERENKNHFSYMDTWFPDSEASEEPCTAKATCYTATIAAALMMNQLILHARGMPIYNDFTFNLLTMEMQICKQETQ